MIPITSRGSNSRMTTSRKAAGRIFEVFRSPALSRISHRVIIAGFIAGVRRSRGGGVVNGLLRSRRGVYPFLTSVRGGSLRGIGIAMLVNVPVVDMVMVAGMVVTISGKDTVVSHEVRGGGVRGAVEGLDRHPIKAAGLENSKIMDPFIRHRVVYVTLRQPAIMCLPYSAPSVRLICILTGVTVAEVDVVSGITNNRLANRGRIIRYIRRGIGGSN